MPHRLSCGDNTRGHNDQPQSLTPKPLSCCLLFPEATCTSSSLHASLSSAGTARPLACSCPSTGLQCVPVQLIPMASPVSISSLTGGPWALEDAVGGSLSWAGAKGNLAAPESPRCCKQAKSQHRKNHYLSHTGTHRQEATMFAACPLGRPLFSRGDSHRSSPMCLTSICLTLGYASSLEERMKKLFVSAE